MNHTGEPSANQCARRLILRGQASTSGAEPARRSTDSRVIISASRIEKASEDHPYNGGPARAYLADSSRRQRSGDHGHPRHDSGVPWIYMQTVKSPECALMPLTERRGRWLLG
jgi:hypothetical protein